MFRHGFKPFRRCLGLNSWLHANGYLALKEGKTESREWFQDVDWSKTRAYALGLGGLFLNVKGREAKGIVEPGDVQALKTEIRTKLQKLPDPETGRTAISRVYEREEVHNGPYVENGPDLIIGYKVGYRTSWDSVTGVVSDQIFEDNKKRWSGDHCILPGAVPGVFFSNWKFEAHRPGLVDMAPTVLKLFGMEPPAYMDGKALEPKGK